MLHRSMQKRQNRCDRDSCLNKRLTNKIYTLSLHDALPISIGFVGECTSQGQPFPVEPMFQDWRVDRKSTRLNSSHRCIPYGGFCLKKTTKTRLRRPPKRARSPNHTTT